MDLVGEYVHKIAPSSFYYYSKPVIQYRVRSDSATIKSHKKGEKYLKYNLLEFYFALLSKVRNQPIRDQIKLNIQNLVNDFPAMYSSEHEDESLLISDKKENKILKKKIYELERGYGYYFYFLYLFKMFIRKFFRGRKA